MDYCTFHSVPIALTFGFQVFGGFLFVFFEIVLCTQPGLSFAMQLRIICPGPPCWDFRHTSPCLPSSVICCYPREEHLCPLTGLWPAALGAQSKGSE